MKSMLATVFEGKDNLRLVTVPRPIASVGEAVIRNTVTAICATDLHNLRGEYPVKPGLIIGHQPVGVLEEVGVGLTGYKSASSVPARREF